MEYDFLDGLERALDRVAGGSEYSIGCLLSSELERVAQQAHTSDLAPDVNVNARKRKPDWEPDWQAGGGGHNGLAPGTSSCQQFNSQDGENPSYTLRRYGVRADTVQCVLLLSVATRCLLWQPVPVDSAVVFTLCL
jgi:hypothetical protein